ncbi:unnamed protein product [Oppiella nova]|uniref:Carbohydrate kinase PfkB domain-containing protein n=1 Tax=Oppiella nova TaxID=334625 RepID=A0A7R9LAQ2_9ACAR|nr:unnamed protein product [Oppiella nova]CAG2161591.1 unnamed protein product [Oppiella nova]
MSSKEEMKNKLLLFLLSLDRGSTSMEAAVIWQLSLFLLNCRSLPVHRQSSPHIRKGELGSRLSSVFVGLLRSLRFCRPRLNGSTYKGSIRSSLGGVGRNIFDGLSRLGLKPLFLSAVGNDSNGHSILNNNPLKNPKGVLISETIPTSSCSVIMDGKGECGLLVGDMRAHQLITKQHVSQFNDDICSAPMVIIDANIPLETTLYTLHLCANYGIPVMGFKLQRSVSVVRTFSLKVSNRMHHSVP